MIISDETLMAYVDGELDSETRAAVAAAIAADPDVAEKIARHEALRASLHAGLAHVLDEAVPERLVRAARAGPAGGLQSTVSDLAQARAARAQPRVQGSRLLGVLPQWGALAASLLLGLIIGQHFLASGDDAPFVTQGGQLRAHGALARALSLQLESTQAQNSAVRMGISFRARSGEYCRTFSLAQNSVSGRAVAGLACREHEIWRVDVVAPGAAGTPGGYRMAGTELPRAVLQAVDEEIAGEPLDARAEATAQQHGWRP